MPKKKAQPEPEAEPEPEATPEPTLHELLSVPEVNPPLVSRRTRREQEKTNAE
jgi:hypothetical protein